MDRRVLCSLLHWERELAGENLVTLLRGMRRGSQPNAPLTPVKRFDEWFEIA